MTAENKLLWTADDGSLGFGNFTLDQKTKQGDFSFQGDIYKVKSFKEITKLEKNDLFVFESVPGCIVKNFVVDEDVVSFDAYGRSDVYFTIAMEMNSEYEIFLGGNSTGMQSTNFSGKLSFSAELSEDVALDVKIVKSVS